VTAGEIVNISEYLDFGFYDHVSFKENAGLEVTSIGRWLGVSHRVGGLMSYWILTIKDPHHQRDGNLPHNSAKSHFT
jgi:hypothetical protein